MGSINAARVANKVSDTIAVGKLVDLEDIIISCGYSKATAKSPSLVTNTKAYKQVMEIRRRPLLEGLHEEINRMKLALSHKDMANEDARTIIYAIDILTKNYQLLSGGATERQVFVLPSEVLQRNAISEKPPADVQIAAIEQTNNGST